METVLWVILAISGLIVFRESVKERIKAGGSIKAGPFELGQITQDLEGVQEKVSTLSDAISSLFLSTMSGPIYSNLKKLASGNFGSYEMGDALIRELYHLRDIGYITVNSIRSVPSKGDNLSEYVKVTSIGKRFVELREQVASTALHMPRATE
jgi:hypothetical protein